MAARPRQGEGKEEIWAIFFIIRDTYNFTRRERPRTPANVHYFLSAQKDRRKKLYTRGKEEEEDQEEKKTFLSLVFSSLVRSCLCTFFHCTTTAIWLCLVLSSSSCFLQDKGVKSHHFRILANFSIISRIRTP